MHFMNTYEIEEAMYRLVNDEDRLPNLTQGVLVLARLAVWTNRNSDGWAYWPKPVRAARRLMELVQSVDRWEPEDVTSADLRKACAPIKAFLTRHDVDHAEVFGVQK